MALMSTLRARLIAVVLICGFIRNGLAAETCGDETAQLSTDARWLLSRPQRNALIGPHLRSAKGGRAVVATRLPAELANLASFRHKVAYNLCTNL